jgi:flavin-dependent dehydrogenase
MELDEQIMLIAKAAGATVLEGHSATDVVMDAGAIKSVIVKTETGMVTINANSVILADGARSQLGRKLGREWHRDTAYGVAARGYITSERHDDPWISSHLELRGEKNEILSGYGWIFPLGNGEVNLGVGALATAKRPADVALRPLIKHYADLKRDSWGFQGPPRAVSSALLPMGGAVSGVAGPNWMLIGDAAACVNPLNGEGIDYGLETGHLAAQLFEGTIPNARMDYTTQWAPILQARYGTAFSIARRLAGLLTVPKLLPTLGPVGMRSRTLMTIALRVMGNLVTEEDTDTTARLWRVAGKASIKLDDRPPFS